MIKKYLNHVMPTSTLPGFHKLDLNAVITENEVLLASFPKSCQNSSKNIQQTTKSITNVFLQLYIA